MSVRRCASRLSFMRNANLALFRVGIRLRHVILWGKKFCGILQIASRSTPVQKIGRLGVANAQKSIVAGGSRQQKCRII